MRYFPQLILTKIPSHFKNIMEIFATQNINILTELDLFFFF